MKKKSRLLSHIPPKIFLSPDEQPRFCDRQFVPSHHKHRFTKFSEIKTTPLKAIASPFVYEGEVVALVGPEGKGKSTVAAMISAMVSCKDNVQPFGEIGSINAEAHGNVAWIEYENGANKTKALIYAHNGDLDKTHLFEASQAKYGYEPPDLQALLSSIPDLKLVVFDSIEDLLRMFAHLKRNRRFALDEITKIARLFKVGVIVITHFSGGNERTLNPLDRIRGGKDIGIILRHIWFFAEIPGPSPEEQNPTDPLGANPENRQQFVMIETKASNKPQSEWLTLRFELENRGIIEPSLRGPIQVIRFRGYATPDERQLALNQFQRMPKQIQQQAPLRDTKRHDAKQWLLDQLKNGPQPATQLIAAAAADGISAMTLRRAREELGIQIQKVRSNGNSRPYSTWCIAQSTHPESNSTSD